MKLLKAEEVAEILSCKVMTIYSMARERKIPYLKVSGMVRFDPLEIEEWLRKCRVAGPEIHQIHSRKKERGVGDIDGIIDKAIREVIGK